MLRTLLINPLAILAALVCLGQSACNGEEQVNQHKVDAPFFAEGQDPKPSNTRWIPVADLSDEFQGTEVDAKKWQTDPIGNGWGWIGRPPGLFRTENVRVADGMLNVTVSPLLEPRMVKNQEFRYQGAIVRSTHPGKVGWYFETRMKANKTSMSSTFWLMTRGGKMRQELDIQECVGQTSDQTKKWGRNWNQIFHSNLIRTQRGEPGKVQIQKSITPPTKNYERFYVYAAWWKSPQEVHFFLDGKYTYSLKPDVDWNLPAYIQLAIETYDWNPVPADGGLVATGSWEERTTKYDWIRVWQLR